MRNSGREESIHARRRLIETGKQTRNVRSVCCISQGGGTHVPKCAGAHVYTHRADHTQEAEDSNLCRQRKHDNRAQISKCRGDGDLGLCNFKIQRRQRSRFVHFLGTCEKRTSPQCQIPTNSAGETRFFRKTTLCSSLFASTQKVYRPRSLSPLHFDMRIIQQIRCGK